MQTVKLLFLFFLMSMPVCSLAQGYVEIGCTPLPSNSRYLQKGDFAIALPGNYKERRIESIDSNVWDLEGDFGEISIDFGFKPLINDQLTFSNPCGGSGEQSIKAFSKGDGRYVVKFVPQYNRALSVEFRIRPRTGELTKAIAEIMSSFRWVGNPVDIQVIETDPKNDAALIKNETGVPFSVVVGDFIARNFGVLKEVGGDCVVVEQYVYDNNTGAFHKKVINIKKK